MPNPHGRRSLYYIKREDAASNTTSHFLLSPFLPACSASHFFFLHSLAPALPRTLLCLIHGGCVCRTRSSRVRVLTHGVQKIVQTRFHAQRVNLAEAGINRMASLFDSKTVQYKDVVRNVVASHSDRICSLWTTGQGYWGSAATVLSAMANLDYFTNSTIYKNHVTSALNTAFQLYPNFDPVCSTRPA
jgi:hypothetical protein